jgi:hypothetical protein
LQSDFKRGKCCRKLVKLLSSKKAQATISRFSTHTTAVIAALFVAHLAFFATLLVSLDKQRAFVYESDSAGRAANNAYRCACRAHPHTRWAAPWAA